MNMREQELENLIRKQAQKYYEGRPDISDAKFDSLVDELREINPNNAILTKVGWGMDASKTPGTKLTHKYQVAGSLDKVRKVIEIKKDFLSNVVIGAKLDGITIVLYYRNGKLLKAITRGDGLIGKDVTEKVIRVVGPTIADKEFTGATRCEALMSDEHWIKYTTDKQIDPDSTTARNVVAGLFNSSVEENKEEVKTDILTYVSLVFYKIHGVETSVNINNYIDVINWLKRNYGPSRTVAYFGPFTNFPTEQYLTVVFDSFKKTYPCDGLVLTNNRVYKDYNNAMLYTECAYKFKSEVAQTTVVEIEWNLSKKNKLKPVAIVDPVVLSGATVSRATAFNAEYVKTKKLGPGSVIEIERSGEVIPDIQEIFNDGALELPTNCPECGHDLVWDGVDLACKNDNCSNKEIKDLIMWVTTIGETDGLGEKLIVKFLAELKLNSVDDFYANDQFKRFKIHDSIQRLKFSNMLSKIYNDTIPAEKALVALNIPRLGDVTAKKLAMEKNLVEAIINYSAETLAQIEEDLTTLLGEATCAAILQDITKFRRLKHLTSIDYAEKEAAKEFVSVVITGKLSVKRADFEKMLTHYGYKVAKSVSSNVKYLITDNLHGTSAKHKDADRLGISKMTEDEFRRMLGQ